MLLVISCRGLYPTSTTAEYDTNPKKMTNPSQSFAVGSSLVIIDRATFTKPTSATTPITAATIRAINEGVAG